MADAAAALGVIQSRTFDGRDPATGGVPLGWQGTGKTRPKNIPTDYTKFVDHNGLSGARIGITRAGLNGFDPLVPLPAPADDAIEAAFEVRGLKAGEFDRKLEENGAESNAATWVDWTYYYESLPKDRLALAVKLESERMAHLVLREPQEDDRDQPADNGKGNVTNVRGYKERRADQRERSG